MSNPFAAQTGGAAYAPPTATEMEQNEPLQMQSPGTTTLPPPQRVVLLFHVLFKALALLSFILSRVLFSGSYVVTFVFVTILSALDFWTVKNVSGRLLVGLRWWNTIDDAGESVWHFESFEDRRFIHPTDSNGFWLALFVAPCLWGFVAFSALFTLNFMWLVLIIVAFVCNAINVVGYVRCKRDAGRKLSALGGTVLARGFDFATRMTGRTAAASNP
mmetsp:Transcript_24807/g.72711  ORF Transcript_24807/g.72711 Transcript_24807/m.72711 type:complete len:217 (+) Transcript_24807:126-776(+)